MSQTSKRMFGCIKFLRRRIQPIQLFKGDQRRLISVYEKNDGNPKCTICLKREKEGNDVMRQLRLKDTVLDYRLPRLGIDNARWVTLDDLLNMECERAFFNDHAFTEEHLKQLRGFNLSPNWEHILEGIEYGVWDEQENKKRPRNFQDHYIYDFEEIDCQNGLDFERKSDGMIGTVMHQSDQIDFFVWNDIQV
ncbi:hypothetical protein CRE_10353 [Caenorhabditis remanei]|uniref:Sdz-33 F-box domain-containing protein n=1 Tax=Caenorhabditis remanei TaxID=31234 RepID=E3MQI3_CAERE|nr:hypothetical protein CRE_10353 [Caenorhabditis remanei]